MELTSRERRRLAHLRQHEIWGPMRSSGGAGTPDGQ
jgi:hypothetical protein